MKIMDAFPDVREQRERDARAEARATAPSRDSRTGELIPHCTGRQHWWYFVRPNVMKCKHCDALKMRDR